jgi:mRNA interferase MazF
MTNRPLAPWQIWWVDFDPVTGRGQRKRRPAVIVSSTFHLRLVRGELLTVLPLTRIARSGWLHRIELILPKLQPSWAITEQVRTVSAQRVAGDRPIAVLNPGQIDEVRSMLGEMLDLAR